MLIHTVFFWLRPDLTVAERATFSEEIHRLARLPYLERAHVGIPAPTERRAVTDHTFDFAISFHFKSLEDGEFYQARCPDHARFVALCQPLWDRVLVYDFTPQVR